MYSHLPRGQKLMSVTFFCHSPPWLRVTVSPWAWSSRLQLGWRANELRDRLVFYPHLWLFSCDFWSPNSSPHDYILLTDLTLQPRNRVVIALPLTLAWNCTHTIVIITVIILFFILLFIHIILWLSSLWRVGYFTRVLYLVSINLVLPVCWTPCPALRHALDSRKGQTSGLSPLCCHCKKDK